MTIRCYFVFLLSTITVVNSIQIPFIQNITLVPRYLWNSTTVSNQTLHSCICLSLSSYVAFNWFSNNSCQLFHTFPITYRIQSTSNARLYFSKGIFPNASQCCMPDINYLLDKLRNGTRTYRNVSTPRNLFIDNNGYLVTAELNPPKLDRFNAQDLSLIDKTNLSTYGSYLMTVVYANNAYFAGFISGPITVIDSQSLLVLNNIVSTELNNMRSIIFLNNAQTMIVSLVDKNATIFFNRSSPGSFNYTFAYKQRTNYTGVHGLVAVNNTYFYSTSYPDKTVYSYSAVANSTQWTETLVLNTSSVYNATGGTFVTIDECGRFWYSFEMPAVYIFDKSGILLGNLSVSNGQIMDTLITDNYVMYFSDRGNAPDQIIRIDPHIQC